MCNTASSSLKTISTCKCGSLGHDRMAKKRWKENFLWKKTEGIATNVYLRRKVGKNQNKGGLWILKEMSSEVVYVWEMY